MTKRHSPPILNTAAPSGRHIIDRVAIDAMKRAATDIAAPRDDPEAADLALAALEAALDEAPAGYKAKPGSHRRR